MAAIVKRRAPFLSVIGTDLPPPWTTSESLSVSSPLLNSEVLPSPPSEETNADFIYEPPIPYFENREKILSDLLGHRLFIFLDYDGTLTPIVSDPCKAVLSPSMRSTLSKLSSYLSVTVGIVTGRALHSVRHFVQIAASEEHLNFVYAASHGFHIEAPNGQYQHRVGLQFIPILRQAALDVASVLAEIQGVALEDNEYAVSIHYRNAPAGCEAEVEDKVDRVLKKYPCLRKTRGKMVLEIRIKASWDKGRAVNWLLQSMHIDPTHSNNRVIYVGDDLTDEDAFKALRIWGNNSIAALVSETPKKTAANILLKDPQQVELFLNDLIDIVAKTRN